MRLRDFLALSRTPHAVLDLATPAFAALVWVNRFPSFKVVILGLITTFAAYTAVYAFNDVIDHREDERRLAFGKRNYGDYLDAAVMRHPIAQGIVSLRAALVWTAGWTLLAAAGSYALNPSCLVIFVAAILLEGAYCRLGGVTPLRTLIAGLVKTAGPLAAVLAVDPNPSPIRLVLLFGWVFFWEIGGQNIPSDWTDIDEDRRLSARTLPVSLAAGAASRTAIVALTGAVGLSFTLSLRITLPGSLLYAGAALVAGVALLLVPAIRLFVGSTRSAAIILFNRASFYPLSLLGVMALKAALRV